LPISERGRNALSNPMGQFFACNPGGAQSIPFEELGFMGSVGALCPSDFFQGRRWLMPAPI